MASPEEPTLAERWLVDRRIRGIQSAILRRTLADLLGEIGINPNDTPLAIATASVTVPVDIRTTLVEVQSFGDLVAAKLGRIIGRHISPDSVSFSSSNDQLLITVHLYLRSRHDDDTYPGANPYSE